MNITLHGRASWRLGLGIASGAAMLAVVACAAPAVTPATATSAAKVTTPAATAAATTAPTTAATTAPTAAATAAAKPTTPAAATSAPATGGVRYQIDPANSTVKYTAREELAGRGLNVVNGSTKDISGTLTLGANNVPAADSTIAVDLRTLRTDMPQRDNFIQRNPLQTAQFPNAEFVVKEIRGLPASIPTSGTATVQMIGDLTIRGITRPVTWDTTLTFTPTGVTGEAKYTFNFVEWGLAKPTVAIVLSIEDQVPLQIDFTATRLG